MFCAFCLRSKSNSLCDLRRDLKPTKAANNTMPTPSICSRAFSVAVVCIHCKFQRLPTNFDAYIDPGNQGVRKGPASSSEFEVTLADMYVLSSSLRTRVV